MSTFRFSPAHLHGTVHAPASKSHGHRLLIAAALSDAPCVIRNIGDSDDIRATIRCLSALGASFLQEGSDLLVTPVTRKVREATLHCGESGTTARFLTPVAAVLADKAHIVGTGRLTQRPMRELLCAMRENGITFSADHIPFDLSGTLKSGDYCLPGNISSQYVSGLLFALPMLEGDSTVTLTTPLSSSGYVNMTIDVLETFGVRVIRCENGFSVPGGQTYRSPGFADTEGDWSGSAFFLAAGAIQGPVTVMGLNPESSHKDRLILDYLSRFGAQITLDADSVTVSRSSLCAIQADTDENPDLVPVLAAVAACSRGTSVFSGCSRLRLKESDRLNAICETLSSFGIRTQTDGETLQITGGVLTGAECSSLNDHRIAMMAAILACSARDSVTLHQPMSITKSYPDFYNDYLALGGSIDGFNIR